MEINLYHVTTGKKKTKTKAITGYVDQAFQDLALTQGTASDTEVTYGTRVNLQKGTVDVAGNVENLQGLNWEEVVPSVEGQSGYPMKDGKATEMEYVVQKGRRRPGKRRGHDLCCRRHGHDPW